MRWRKLVESRIRGDVYVRFGGEYLETCRSHAIRRWVLSLLKTVRKFYGEAIVVTQEIEDIISSPVVKQAILNNSDCKILLDQRKYQNSFEQVQELLGLTDKEKAMVLSVNKANDPSKQYKEVFISLGGVLSKVYRIEVSPQEYYSYTTEETEKIAVMESAERYGGDIKKGIQMLANKQASSLEDKKQ